MSNDCIFCKIAAGEIGGPPVYQDEEVTAFRDINPQAPHHILVIPNEHISSLNEAADGHQALLGKLLLTAAKIAADQGLAETGYRLVLNTGPQAGQTVFHIHLHLLGGRRMAWPPG
ncbi:MAG: histidine triad nucleotide-binding protein [Chloroflexi bacterium]|nr:MAG: histidine triad nucleotide-binding protein [Chloroflexota bacterium]